MKETTIKPKLTVKRLKKYLTKKIPKDAKPIHPSMEQEEIDMLKIHISDLNLEITEILKTADYGHTMVDGLSEIDTETICDTTDNLRDILDIFSREFARRQQRILNNKNAFSDTPIESENKEEGSD